MGFVNFLTKTTTGRLTIVMWVLFFIQYVLYPALVEPVIVTQDGEITFSETFTTLFVLDYENPHHVWTYVTSMFTHGNFIHLLVNSIVFLSFGAVLERKLSTQQLLGLFFVGGLLAAGGQMLMTWIALNTAYLTLATSPMQFVGASGAIAAVIGILTTFRPTDKVYLFFILPMQLSTGIAIFITVSATLIVFVGVGAFSMGHTAHLAGLFTGLAYGYYLKQKH